MAAEWARFLGLIPQDILRRDDARVVAAVPRQCRPRQTARQGTPARARISSFSLDEIYTGSNSMPVAAQSQLIFEKPKPQVIFELKAGMQSVQQILIVDDDAASRTLLVRMLSSAGYACRESDNALDALQLVQEEQP